jgi:hypothetical protein
LRTIFACGNAHGNNFQISVRPIPAPPRIADTDGMEYKKPIAVALAGTLVTQVNLSTYFGFAPAADLPPVSAIATIASTGIASAPIYCKSVFCSLTDERIDAPTLQKNLIARSS